ncbi:MAG: hypothetical protein DWQ19_11395 [Crenarchaeota archaeon]|nr:MAG: hypothetical protein DWQ19_11395 [Thermoproteota archaeon]
MPAKESKPEYPSQFGSHASMIDQEATDQLGNPDRVVLKDDHGVYETDRNRLDNGLADPNRYRTSRLGKLFGQEKDEEAKKRKKEKKKSKK